MTVKGSTRIQKYGFLASQLYSKELTSLNFYKDWVPYSYGPHSMELVHDLQKCVEQDLIEDNVEITHNGRQLHIYSLKLRGRSRLNKLSQDYGEIIKNLYEKFTALNRKSINSVLKDIYEAYPNYTVNSKIKQEVLESTDKFIYEKLETEELNPEIKQKLELIQSGGVKGKKYSPSEYLQHIDNLLED